LRELRPEELRRRCDPELFDFETTAEIEPLKRGEVIGQERAIEALECGLGIKDSRYNIYVAGGPGTGKMSIVQAFLERISAEEPRPPDICYVHNFEDPYSPRYLLLPPGMGSQLRADMGKLIELVRRDLPTALGSEEYQEQKRKIDDEINRRKNELFASLKEEARARGFLLQRTPIGINTIPLIAGQPMTEEQFKQLTPEERAVLERRGEEIKAKIEEAIRQTGQLEEERARRLEELNRRVAAFAIEPKVNVLKEAYRDHPRVVEFLEGVKQDILANLPAFLEEVPDREARERFKRYTVNVLVDNSKTEGAPVVVENNATYPNLFGRVERRVHQGVMVADFTQIRPGSLHRANGGYLVLSADNLFRYPLSWEALKVALKSGQIAIEDPAATLGYAITEGLKPEPIPMNVKLIIVGSREIYDLLQAFDEDFQEFFKIKSEFDSEMDWDERYIKQFGPFIRARVLERGLRDFDRSGVARVVEYAAELTGDQKKLSARFSDIMAIIREASYCAEQDGSEYVTAEHVERAIQRKHYRSNLIEEKIQEMIARGELRVEVEGAKVGQVNGLSVYNLGDFSFGRPTRITATVFAGKDGVVNIEREAELSGKIHTKGLLILKGWLGEKFAYDKPLSLSANLTFEQSYSPVDGDSASSTEAYALISALSGVPLKQGIAVTGSIDQKGEVQPIGGVNEKIEGFYKTCKLKGLSGEQGVIIPEGNVENLMLSREVIEAVREGRFHIWAIKNLDEGIELLTGQPAGRRLENGQFEEGTIYWKVDKRLRELGESLKGEKGEEEEGG